MGIDDAADPDTVQGVIGVFGVIALGVFSTGFPSLQSASGEAPMISLIGQIIGAAVFALTGFVPGYIVANTLKAMGMLCVPEAAEIHGLYLVKVASAAYPEGIPTSASPAE